MSVYKGIPFNGGMDSPTGTGAQHIVETCEAICNWMINGGTVGVLFDASLVESIDWNMRLMSSGDDYSSLDWANRLLLDNGANFSLDWTQRFLLNQGENVSVDWQNALLYDLGVELSVDWGNRVLYSTAGNAMFQWSAPGIGFFNTAPVAQQAGGAATAGAVYTATEKDMINRMYTALRNYGLLT